MAEIGRSVAFYQKTAELQEKLRKSEEERLKLEEKFAVMVRACREEEEARLLALQDMYERFLREDRRQRERNERILQALDRIESHAAMMSAKTDRLKLLRRHYEAYLSRVYPEWKLQDRISNRKTSLGPEQFRPYLALPRYSSLQAASDNSAVKEPPLPHIDKYKHTDTAPDKLVGGSNLASRPSINVVNFTKLPFSSSLKNISNVSRNVLPSKHLDATIGEWDYMKKPGLSYRNKTFDTRNRQPESNAENLVHAIGSGFIKRSEDSRFGSICDLEVEQNTSRDLLNLSLSDDGIVQEEVCPDIPVHYNRFKDESMNLPLTKGSMNSNAGNRVGPVNIKCDANVSHLKSENVLTDKQNQKMEKIENFANNLGAGLRVMQPLPKDDLKTANNNANHISSRQEEVQGDVASVDMVSGHELSDDLNAKLNGSRQYYVVQSEKLKAGEGNRSVDGKQSPVRYGDMGAAEIHLPVEGSTHVEILQRNPELMQAKCLYSEPPAAMEILQEVCENNQHQLVLKTDHIPSQPISLESSNKMRQNVTVPLPEVNDQHSQDREFVGIMQTSKFLDNEGYYNFNNESKKGTTGETRPALSGQNSNKDSEKLTQHSNVILEGHHKIPSSTEVDNNRFVAQSPKLFDEGVDNLTSEEIVDEKVLYTGCPPPDNSVHTTPNKEIYEQQHGIQQKEEDGQKTIAKKGGKYKYSGEEKLYSMDTEQFIVDEKEQYQAAVDEGQYIVDEVGQYQKVGEDGQYTVDEKGQSQTIDEEEKYIVDEAGEYQKVDVDGQYSANEGGQYQEVGEGGQYVVNKPGQYQKVSENGQYLLDEGDEYLTVGEEGQFIVDEAGQYQKVGRDEQYVVDDELYNTGEGGQYILDEAGQYQNVDEDGQYIVDEEGQYHPVGEGGQYIVDEAGQYQKVGEHGQYIEDEGQYQTVDEQGQYIVDDAGQYQKVGEDGQYIIDDGEQYQTVGDGRQYIIDESGQHKEVGANGKYIGNEEGQYIVDEEGQYIVDEEGQYIVDEVGQYQKVGENGQYIEDEGQYQTVDEQGQYIVDESGQYQKVSEDGQYVVDEEGQYKTISELGQCQAIEEGQNPDGMQQYQMACEGEQHNIDKSGKNENADANECLIIDDSGQYQKNGKDGTHQHHLHETDQLTVSKDNQNQKTDEQERCVMKDQREQVTASQQLLNSVSDDGQPKQAAEAERRHATEQEHFTLDNQFTGGCSSAVDRGQSERLDHHSRGREKVSDAADRLTKGGGTNTFNMGSIGDKETTQSQDDTRNLGERTDGTAATRSDSKHHGDAAQPQCSSPRSSQGDRQHSSQSGQLTNDPSASSSREFDVDQSSSESIQSGRASVAQDVGVAGGRPVSEQEPSREAVNQRVRQVLEGLGQDSSDESSDVPAPLQPAPAPGRADPLSTVPPTRGPTARAAVLRKLPGLSAMMESDSESLQLDVNPAMPDDESDDFDFSSEK